MSRRRFAIPPVRLALGASAAALAPGCSIFGDPILGVWEVETWDAYDPLRQSAATDEGAITGFSREFELDLNEVDGGEILGTFSYTYVYTYSGPGGAQSDRSNEKFEATAIDEGKSTYEIDVDSFGDWACELTGEELQCEDDDGGELIFERTG